MFGFELPINEFDPSWNSYALSEEVITKLDAGRKSSITIPFFR